MWYNWEESLCAKSIDNIIDEDLKNNLIVFNHNLSEDLKLKLLDVNSSFMPIRDKRFEEVLEDYAKNRVIFNYIFWICVNYCNFKY